MANATDNLLEAEKMIRQVMDGGKPTEKTLEICKWLLSFNDHEKTHRVMCYRREDPSIRFCFDRPGYADTEGTKIATVFLTIRPDLTIILKPTTTVAHYLKPDGQYHRINGGDARNISIESLKRHILEAYCNKLPKFGLDSIFCHNINKALKLLPKSEPLIVKEGEIPTREEIEAIMRIGREVHEDVLKKALETAFVKSGRKLRPDWWEITKKNLIEWSKKG